MDDLRAYLDDIDGGVEQRGHGARADVHVRLRRQVLVAHLDLGELDAHPASTPIQIASISTERSNSNSKTLQQQGTAANWGNSQVEAVPEAAEQALVVVLDGLEHALHELPALARVQVRDVHLVGRQLPLLLQAERAGGARDAE